MIVILLVSVTLAFQALFLLHGRGPSRLRKLFDRAGNARARDTLSRTVPFYRQLPPAGQRAFALRVQELVYEKDWIGRGLRVTEEMKLRIAAAIAQVTFGFEGMLLLHFRRIAVYPDVYRNPRTGRMHQGEVAPAAGLLVLSWKHFEAGFDRPADGVNLALHEVAHALWAEDLIPNAEHNFLNKSALRLWSHLAKEEMERIRRGDERLFRAYAATNEAEFFAVAVEYFFERPEEFEAQLPHHFECLARLLRQRPRQPAKPLAVNP